MDNRKLERIVICILLVLNLTLLTVVCVDRGQQRRDDEEIRENTAAALSACGICISEDAIVISDPAPACTLLRDSEAESGLVREILGSSSVEDLGGNILFYRSGKGQAVFRGSGEFEILFSSEAYPIKGGTDNTARRLLRHAGIEYAEADFSGENGTESTAVYLCCRNGYPVFNAVLNFDFTEESVYMLTGIRLFDSAAADASGELLDSVSALLHIAKLVQEGTVECSEIQRLVPGYQAEVVVSGKCSLRPVWQIQTDCGILLLDAETGEILRETA